MFAAFLLSWWRYYSYSEMPSRCLGGVEIFVSESYSSDFRGVGMRVCYPVCGLDTVSANTRRLFAGTYCAGSNVAPVQCAPGTPVARAKSEAGRGDAAAATLIYRGDESRRRGGGAAVTLRRGTDER